MKTIRFDGSAIGPRHPCFIIAEAGVNHNGSLDLALRLVDAAAAAGADAVKFQTFKAERLVAPGAPKADYQKSASNLGETQFEMLKKLELSEEAHRELMSRCAARKIKFLSTPFDEDSADFLDALGVPAFKIGSGELTNLPLISHVASKRKPLIVSTGMATIEEVEAALDAAYSASNREVALLHCASAYPADPAAVNLRAMRTMEKKFGVPVGLSDHTEGIEVAIAAVALGARVLEKHFTLDRDLPGPDHKMSLRPEDLAELARSIRTVELALGDGNKAPVAAELEMARVARRSLVAARNIPAGTMLTREDIAIRRPGNGLAPGMLLNVVGKTVARDIAAGDLLSLEMLRP